MTRPTQRYTLQLKGHRTAKQHGGSTSDVGANSMNLGNRAWAFGKQHRRSTSDVGASSMSLGNRAWAFGVLVQRPATVLVAAFPVRGDCCVARLQLALPALAATAGMPADSLMLLLLI